MERQLYKNNYVMNTISLFQLFAFQVFHGSEGCDNDECGTVRRTVLYYWGFGDHDNVYGENY